MYAETYRPSVFDEIVGHEEPKRILKEYLTTPPYKGAILLTGTAGIGKLRWLSHQLKHLTLTHLK